MNYKELFVSADLDFCHYAAVIFDSDAHQFYNALFSERQTGGAIGYYIEKPGSPVSAEQAAALAEKSEDSRAGKFSAITNNNRKDLIK